MKYALIGCGRISVNHIKAAVNNNLEITAVCDVLPERMESVLEKHGLEKNTGIKRYTDYRQMISENRIELISIATQSGLHAEIALYCIEHGIHVIIEKPIAMSMEDADKITSLSEEKNVKVCACHQNRFNIAVQELRRALEAGRFGKLSHGSIHVRWNRNREYYEQAPWRGTWAQDGGGADEPVYSRDRSSPVDVWKRSGRSIWTDPSTVSRISGGGGCGHGGCKI